MAVTDSDAGTGKDLRNDFGAFELEVLNAEWISNAVAQALASPANERGEKRGQRPPGPRVVSDADAEAYLRNIYLLQTG